MTDQFDAVVVGGDLAAGVFALALVGAKARVAVVAPDPPQAGPVALVWPAEVDSLRPELAAGMPGRAPLVEHRWQLLDGLGAVSVEYRAPPGGDGTAGPSGWVEGVAGRWLLEKARSAGAVVRYAPAQLLTQGGRGAGARAGEETLSAPLTVVSDPPATAAEDPAPSGGLSRTYTLGSGPVSNRFGIRARESLSVEAVLAFAAPPTRAVGTLVATGEYVEAAVFAVDERGRASPPEPLGPLLSQFTSHPTVAPLLKGASTTSAPRKRWLPGAGRTVAAAPGVLRIGRAAGIDTASGPLTTGPGYSVRAALLASEAVQSCWRAGDAAADGATVRFDRLLERGGVRKALLAQRHRSSSVAFRSRLRQAYPPVVRALLHRLMTETGGKKESVVAAVKAVRKGHPLRTGQLALDALEVGGAL